MGGREAGAGAEDAPAVTQVQAEVPGAGAAHGKATQDDPVAVHETVTPRQTLGSQKVVQSFQDVSLSGPAIGIVAASKDIDLDMAQIRRRCLVPHEILEELHFRERAVTTVQHHVEAPFFSRFLAVGRREGNAVRLHGAIDARAIGTQHGGARLDAQGISPVARKRACNMPRSRTSSVQLPAFG